MAILFQVPQVVDIAGGVASAVANFYAVGTLNIRNVYSDSEATVSLGSQVSADASGWFTPVYLEDQNYRCVVTVNGVTQYDYDPVVVSINSSNVSTSPVRNADAFTSQSELADGSVIAVAGLSYKISSNSTGADSATNDLNVDGIIPAINVSPEHFGAVGDGVADDTIPFQRAVDYCIAAGIKRFTARGKYNIPAGSDTVNDFGVVQEHPVFDILSLYGVMINEANGVTFDFTGAEFITDHGNPICVYNSVDTEVIGGKFTATGAEADIISDQASAVQIIRSRNCVGRNITADGFYRGLVGYRAPECGFTGCTATGAIYYNAYISSTLDISVGGLTSGAATTGFLKNSKKISGGGLGNVWVDNGEIVDNELGPIDTSLGSFTSHAHIYALYGPAVIKGNNIMETAAQNMNPNTSGIIRGINVAPASIIFEDLEGIVVEDNVVDGCYQAIKMQGVKNFSCSRNTLRNWYQTGIALVSNSSLDVNGDTRLRGVIGGVVHGNKITNMNPDSTQSNVGNDKNAGLQVEKNTANVSKVDLSGNQILVGHSQLVKPTYDVYIEADEGSVQFAPSNSRDAVQADGVVPSWASTNYRIPPQLVLVAAGSTSEPVTVLERLYEGGVVVVVNGASVELPDIDTGEITFSATNSLLYIFSNGATDGVAGTQTVLIPGESSSDIGARLTGPGEVVVRKVNSTSWLVSPSGGATVIPLT